MIATLTFPIIAAGLVYLAGRRDTARDPRLTIPLLVISGIFPLMALCMPKLGILPATTLTEHPDRFPWAEVALTIWALGFAIALVRLIVAAAHLHRWKSLSIETSRIHGVAVRELPHLHSPVAAGIFEPVIFVPQSWRGWTDDSLRAVLEHELAHHRRHDPLWRLLAELACAVYWFHPLIHWMKRRFIMQCEFACDTIVLQQGIDPKTYARTLCEFAQVSSTSPLAPAMAEGPPLESRVRRMLRPPEKISRISATAFATIGLVAACSLSVLGPRSQPNGSVPTSEIELRLTANPFPADS